MRIDRWISMAAFCGALSLSALSAPINVEWVSGDLLGAAEAQEDQLYSDATRAINEGRWSDAEPLLDRISNLHGRKADAAVYWKAYVRNKEGRPSDAIQSCASLRQSYPQSSWLNDCHALEIEIRGKSGDPVQPQAEQDEELKLLALNSIIQGGNPNALPILQQILEGQHSERLKERALFVLAEDQSKQAKDLLGQIVRGERDPNLQIKAIRLLAAAQGPGSAETLASIYGKSGDASVKKAVLDAYLVINDPEKVLQAAQHESDPQLARHAVSELGAMGAVSRLSDLYRASSNKEIKTAIINAYVAAGNKGADALGAIASSEQDPDLRHKAIRNLGPCGGPAATQALVSIYSKTNDVESKKAAADGLFVAGDAHDLVTLARSEKDPAARKNIVSKLAVMNDKEATDYMLEILNK